MTNTANRFKKIKNRINIFDAVPGGRKTTSLIKFIHQATRFWNIPEQRILSLTFCKSMSDEMTELLVNLGLARINVNTLHAFCLELIKQQPDRYNLSTGLEVITNEIQYLKSLYHKAFSKPPIPLKLLVKAYNSHYNKRVSISTFLKDNNIPDHKISEVSNFLKQFTQEKIESNKITFSDMTFKVLKQLTLDSDYLEETASQFDILAVDEYQDLNATERNLIDLLVNSVTTSLIVGDDLQAIHGFRGSDINAMQNLIEEFPDANIVKRHHSYRLTTQNAAFVNSILKYNSYQL